MTERTATASRGTLHQKLRSDLQRAILEGTYEPGQFLPSERELCLQHGVSRITAVRALNDLARMGLVRRVHGRGTEVVRSRIPWHVASAMNLEELAKSLGQVSHIEIIERREVDVSDLPPMLAMGLHGSFHRLLRLRYVGDLPVMLSRIWFPRAFASRYSQELLDQALPGSKLENAMPERIARNVQRISACQANREAADILRIPEGSALLQLSGVVSLADGTAVQINDSLFNAAFVEVQAEMMFQQPEAQPVPPQDGRNKR